MSTSPWPVAAAFEPVEGCTRNTDPVTLSVTKSPKRGQQVTLSLSGAVCSHNSLSKGDRFAVSIAETASAIYIRLQRDPAGWARLSTPSGFGHKGAAPRRMLVRLGALSGHDLPVFAKQAVEYRAEGATQPVAMGHDGPAPLLLSSLTVRMPRGQARAAAGTIAVQPENRDVPLTRPGAEAAMRALRNPPHDDAPCPKDSPAAQAARRLHRQGLGAGAIATKVSEDQNVRVDESWVRSALHEGANP